MATRLAIYLQKRFRKRPTRAIALDFIELGKIFKVTPDYVRKMTMRMRKRAWAYQEYGIAFYVRHKRHQTARCGHAVVWAINRHYIHTIGGAGTPRVKWHAHKKGVAEWEDFHARLVNLSWSLLYRGNNPADGTHKGLRPILEDRKQKAEAEKSTRWRAFKGFGAVVNRDHQVLDPDKGRDVAAWASRRAAEGHTLDRVVACLGHASREYWRCVGPGWKPLNRQSWQCGVAQEHLEMDGLTPYIRWREQELQRQKRQAAGAATFKVKRQRELEILERHRQAREHLRERKTLPSGRQIEYDPHTGNWYDL